MSADTPTLSLIWAMGENGVIGRDNALPWRLPADLAWFRRHTTGHHIIMGRKTYESLPKLLPNRTHVIVTSDPGYRAAPGCVVVNGIDEAIAKAAGNSEIFVVGGATLYAQTLPRADRLYVTLVHGSFAGDARFPDFDWDEWEEEYREAHPADDRNAYSCTFRMLKRKRRTQSPAHGA